MDKQKYHEPGIRETIAKDLQRGDFWVSIKQDWRELKEFFLSSERKEKLGDMFVIKRWLFMPFWLMKSLYLHLNPARRILLLFSAILLIASNGKEQNTTSLFFSGLIVFFILMLELKDKLLARDELAAGRSVQAALMPEEQPVIEGWQLWLITKPANDVGGDIVDFIELDEKKRYLALSDISGKGLGAALLAAKLQSTVRALISVNISLSDLVSQVNSIFYRDTPSSSFASMFYLELETNNGEIHFVNAGHMPPYIFKNKELIKLEKGGPALGLMKNVSYKESSITMNSGDFLFLYSDGVSEAENENGAFFGEKRLELLLNRYCDKAPKYLGNIVLNSIADFVGEAAAHDDISMLILKKE